MPKKLTKTEIAVEGVRRFYHTMFEPQLAAYHRVPRHRIRAWKEGRLGPPRADESIQNTIHVGALGSGKSIEQRFQEIALSALIQDNYGVIVRKRWEELHNHVIDDLYRFANEITEGNRAALMSEPKRVGASYEIYVYTTGVPSKIIIKPEPDGTNEQIENHFRGPEYGWASLEEALQLKEITFRTLMGRLRRKFYCQFPKAMWEAQGKPKDNYEEWVKEMSSYLWSMLAVCNPPYEGHWVDKYTKEGELREAREELEREHVLVVRSSMRDNKYLPEAYIRTQEELYKNDPILRAMLIDGKNGIRIDGVPVYGKMFRSDIHCSKDLGYNPFRPLLVGMDFGYLRPAVVFAQETDHNQFNVLGELCPQHKTVEELGELTLDYISKQFPKLIQANTPVLYFGDHAGTQRTDKGDTTIERLSTMGINVMTRPLDLESSINSIRMLLTKMIGDPIRPRLMLNQDTSPLLVQAMIGGYHYKMSGGQRDPRPYKTTDNHMDDVCDAARYLFANVIGPYGQSVIDSYAESFSEPVFATGIAGQRGGPA